MNRRFVIQWKSKLNGRAGRGSKEFEHDEAARIAAELNAEYPDIEHEAVVAPQASPPEGEESHARAPGTQKGTSSPRSAAAEEKTLSE